MLPPPPPMPLLLPLPFFPCPVGGLPCPGARRQDGALLGVGHAPAGVLAHAAADGLCAALGRAVAGGPVFRGKLLAALLALYVPHLGNLSVDPGRASLAVGARGSAMRYKAAPAQSACPLLCPRSRTRRVSSGMVVPLPAAAATAAAAGRPLPLHGPAAVGGPRPLSRPLDGALLGVGHVQTRVLALEPPRAVDAALVRAVADDRIFRGKLPAALLALCVDRAGDIPVGLGRAPLAVDAPAARLKALAAQPACGRPGQCRAGPGPDYKMSSPCRPPGRGPTRARAFSSARPRRGQRRPISARPCQPDGAPYPPSIEPPRWRAFPDRRGTCAGPRGAGGAGRRCDTPPSSTRWACRAA